MQDGSKARAGHPNHQIIKIHQRPKAPNGYRGSHQIFWDLYYEGCASFAPWVPPALIDAVTPVNSDRVWQITSRNEVNYDMALAFEASSLLNKTANPKRLDDYGGALGQQREVTESTLKLAVHFANQFGLSSFPFEGLHPGPRPSAFRALVTKPAPGLVTQSVLQQLFQ